MRCEGMTGRRLAAMLFLVLLGITACEPKDEGDETAPFDRKAMLENYADSIIIPAYSSLSGSLGTLAAKSNAFIANPSLLTLQAAQDAWKTSYLGWQYANAFNFGPAGEDGLRKGLIEEIGTFPISVNKVEAAMNSGSYNLTDFNRDARGFFAVEFLLFSITDDQDAVLERFSEGYASVLLVDLVANIDARVGDVLSEWNGGYRANFISNSGTDVGSSSSKFYNEFVRSFEALKNFKLGLPLGLRPGQTAAEPGLVEAYYSGHSAEGLTAHFTALEDIWWGRSRAGFAGIGFANYLRTVTGGTELYESTEAQLEVINAKLDALPLAPSLSQQVVATPEAATDLHMELQRNTRYFKSDMSSLLGLAITFSSGDGD